MVNRRQNFVRCLLLDVRINCSLFNVRFNCINLLVLCCLHTYNAKSFTEVFLREEKFLSKSCTVLVSSPLVTLSRSSDIKEVNKDFQKSTEMKKSLHKHLRKRRRGRRTIEIIRFLPFEGPHKGVMFCVKKV